jgi:hypothetical protein
MGICRRRRRRRRLEVALFSGKQEVGFNHCTSDREVCEKKVNIVNLVNLIKED